MLAKLTSREVHVCILSPQEFREWHLSDATMTVLCRKVGMSNKAMLVILRSPISKYQGSIMSVEKNDRCSSIRLKEVY